jgi:hypothetical protein
MKRGRVTEQATDLAAVLKRTPSPLFLAARTRSGAGVHRNQKGRYSRRERAISRQEERRVRLEAAE